MGSKLGRLGCVASVVIVSVLLARDIAHAQEQATPPVPEIVPGSECTTAPRPVTFLSELLATPVSSEPYVMPTSVPEGAPVDAEIEREIRAVVRQFLACSNSGDVLRALAFLDDNYLRRIVDPTGELDPDTANELIESLATPEALDDDHLVIFLGIREMVQMPDGRIAVVLETDGGVPNPKGTDVDLFIFARINDQWLITDAVNDIDDLEAKSNS